MGVDSESVSWRTLAALACLTPLVCKVLLRTSSSLLHTIANTPAWHAPHNHVSAAAASKISVDSTWVPSECRHRQQRRRQHAKDTHLLQSAASTKQFTQCNTRFLQVMRFVSSRAALSAEGVPTSTDSQCGSCTAHTHGHTHIYGGATAQGMPSHITYICTLPPPLSRKHPAQQNQPASALPRSHQQQRKALTDMPTLCVCRSNGSPSL